MGALQAGLLRSFVQRGFRPSRIVGTSVGALNGAFLAFYPDAFGMDRLADIWRSLENERFISVSKVRLAFRLAAGRRHLFDNDIVRGIVAQHAVDDDFAAAKIPLYVTTTDLVTGGKQVFHSGPVSQAVLASSAIPGVFSPVDINGHAYIDGGVVANLDLETAIELGANDILAIDLSHCFELPQPKNVIGVITRTVDIVMRERVERDIELLGQKAHITLIQPKIEEGPGLGELSHVSRLIESGESFGEQIAGLCFDDNGRLRPGVIKTSLAIPA